MTTTSLMPSARARGWTNAGLPAAGCKLYTYEAGTTTPKATYQDAAGTVPHTNPIVLDAKGEALIYWDGNYKIDLRTAAGAQITGYPVDNFETPLMAGSLVGGAASGGIGFNYALTYAAGSIGKWLQDLALSAGSSFIGFIQAGVGAMARSSQAKMREWVSILDDGGSNDGVTINSAALTALFTAGFRRIRFPAGGANNYVFDATLSAASSAGMEWDIDAGVTITVPDIGYLSPSLKVMRRSRIALSGLNCEFYMIPERGAVGASRPPILAQSEIDYTIVTPIYPNASGLVFKNVAWPAGDTFTVESPAATSISGVQYSPAVDGLFHCALRQNMHPGEEVTQQFTGVASTVLILAMIRTTTGYHGVYCGTSDFAASSYFEKYTGSAAAVVPLVYPGFGTHKSYDAYKSLWTIRVNSTQNFSILFNGLEVVTNFPTTGEIIEVGFGVYASAAAAAITMQDWVHSKFKKQGGKSPLRIAIFGDSRADASMPDTWPSWLRGYLDGWNGMRMHEINNYAHSGDGVTEQAILCTPANVANVDLVLIDIGTNNIQAGMNEVTYSTALQGMITTCQSQGKRVILGIPDLFYGQAVAGSGVGQATTNYDLGKGIRAKCLRLAADMGVKVVDKMEVLGPVSAQYVNAGIANSYVPLGLDPIMYDSIHPTAFGQQLVAAAFSRAIAGMVTSRPDVTKSPTALDPAALLNGWTMSSQAPKWSRDASGVVSLIGILDAGTKVNGTVMYTLPEQIRPTQTARFPCFGDGGLIAFLNVDTTGEITIYGMNAASAWVALDSICFPTRLT